jgi:hypothetical protein
MEAREKLSQVARRQGVSAAAQLDKLIEDAWWQAVCAAERAAVVADQANPAVAAEDALWEATVSDGIGPEGTDPDGLD